MSEVFNLQALNAAHAAAWNAPLFIKKSFTSISERL